MEHETHISNPSVVLHLLDSKLIDEQAVIDWAEKVIATDDSLASDPALLEIAWTPRDSARNGIIVKSLEDMILRTKSFLITDEMLRDDQEFASKLLNEGFRESITQKNCIRFVLGCCPEVAHYLHEAWAFARGHYRGLYNDLSAFNDHIVECVKCGDIGPLTRSLECIEAMFNFGDSEVSNAAAVGVIEGVTNRCMNNEIPFEAFVNSLGPQSQEAYLALEKFWNTQREEHIA